MPRIEFFVDHAPIAQPRHQVSGKSRWIKPPKGMKAHPVIAYKQLVAIRAREALNGSVGGKVIDGPVSIIVVFLLPRPKHMIWKTKPMPRAWAPGKPDWDNLAKAICDALKNVLWNDDGQIVHANISTFYANGVEKPGVHVIVEEAHE